MGQPCDVPPLQGDYTLLRIIQLDFSVRITGMQPIIPMSSPDLTDAERQAVQAVLNTPNLRRPFAS
jgi:hypothetical protein